MRDPQCFLTPLHSAQRQFLRMAKTAIGSAEALPWGVIGDVSQDDCGWAASGLRSAKLRGHAVKSQVGVGADRRNGGQANNDDQGQHDRVLNGSRAVFVDQKMTGMTKEIGHERTFRETCDEDEVKQGSCWTRDAFSFSRNREIFSPEVVKAAPSGADAPRRGRMVACTRTTAAGPPADYEALSFVATLLNVVLALVPIAVMAVKHTMMISANITAYSTAVGPSSEIRKRCTFKVRFFIASSTSAAATVVTVPHHQKPSPPGATARTSRRPALRRVKTHT